MEENAGIDVIRKQYHKLGRVFIERMVFFFFQSAFSFSCFLRNAFFFFFCAALQLHPDKNKHPKAEIAFKLVSEV